MKLPNRVLYTGDCTYLFQDEIYNPAGERYTARVFYDHVRRLAQSGVDTVLVNPNGQRAWYPSRSFPTVFDDYKRGDREFFRRHVKNCYGIGPDRIEAYLDKSVRFFQNYLDLADAGIDWVSEMARACREYGLAPWISVRMNDLHGTGDQEGSYMNCPLYRDPAMRLSGRAPNPRDGVTQYWQGLNYQRPEVRDYMMSLIVELVNEYDYEGLELDWLRNPQCCEPVASDSVLETMIEWIGEIRALTQRKSEKTGRPYPLGLRIAGNLEMVRSLGLDVAAMAKAGLIDFVSPSNFWQTAWDLPHDELSQTLGQHVTIYGVVEDAPNWEWGYSPTYDRKGPRMLSASPQLLRGNAAGKLVLGAQGIEVFNFFCTDSDVWQTTLERQGTARYEVLGELADLQGLRGKAKHYALSNLDQGTAYPPYELPEQLPVIIEPQMRRAFRIPMCAEPAGRGLKLVVQLILDVAESAAPDLGISINGAWPNYENQSTDRFLFPVGIYTHLLPQRRGLNFTFDADQIKEGWNQITVYNNAGFYQLITTGRQCSPEERQRLAVRLVSLELAIIPAEHDR